MELPLKEQLQCIKLSQSSKAQPLTPSSAGAVPLYSPDYPKIASVVKDASAK